MKKTAVLITLAVIVLVSTTGCLRSASTAPAETSTLAFLQPTQNVVSIAQTATALAMVRLTGTPEAPGTQATNPFVTPNVSSTKSIATNTPAGPTPTSSRKDYSYDPAPNSTYPRISIAWVDADSKVGIKTYGFLKAGTYTVSMGVGPRGGTIITTGTGGESTSFNVVYNIPAELKGVSPLYIRVDFSDGTYTYNWFYNITTQ
ncbi:MAG: hypothetical protein JW704_07855 [Anaerolineaceae bacterium]|nr:hypothetical protein [Anaerolineaceae bacterium]MBN2677127.1 hypothetical protein [Anaerolineaceae bacterium]